jgi:hypothetical protein
MTIVRKTAQPKKRKYRPNLWFERLMALVATLNLLLVIFDLSYVPLRDFWLQGHVRLGNIKSAYIETEGIRLDLIPKEISDFITQYDDVKGIVPDRDTTEYLVKVEQIKEILANNNLESPTVKSALQDLRASSIEMIETNPFAEAGKTGTLEQIKNRMREHLPNAKKSAKQSFSEFWSVNHLKNNTTEELNFFSKEIQPLIERNYYRYLGENGGYVDNFGLLDFPLGIIFSLEFLARTWYISRTRTGVNWLDAMLWRWYDIFFLIPFWRSLRIIPVIIRLEQAQIIDLSAIQKQISQGLVAGIAEDVTEVVVIRVINQIQTSIRQGDIGKLLSQHNTNPYIDLNNINETVEIIKIIAHLIVYQVLPKIKPEAEALLQYSVEKVIKQTPAYQGIKFLPGSDRALDNLTEQMVKQVYQTFADALGAALEEDKKFNQLLESLLTNLTQSLSSEIKAKQSLDKIELLLIDLLEEIKINYVERLSTEDVEEILEQTRALRQITQN